MAERTGDTGNPESKEPSVKRPGTILVNDVPSELSQNDIWIYFQKKKHSGGEVLDVSMKSDTGEALVYFEDCEVAEAVVQHQGHVIKGHAVNAKFYDENKDKKRRTVLISGLPNDATKASITIHFQKKKHSGGEIEDVKILETGKALVVFENLEVAKAIVNTKQIFERDAVLTLERMGMELDPIKAVKQGDTDFAGKENRTILVSDLPQEVTKNGVFIHFQKKKNKGGEVEEVTLLPEGNEAWVIFEDPKVAEAVVSTNQRILGKLVRVKLLKTETQPSVTPGTILVSGLPEGATEKSISMHFQVKKVQLSPDGKQATVTFDDIEVAKTAVSTPQVIKNTPVTVTLLDNEKELVEETSPDVVAKPEVTRTPEVRTPLDGMETPEAPTTREVQSPVAPTTREVQSPEAPMTREVQSPEVPTEGNPSEAKVEKTKPDNVRPFFLVRQVDQVFSTVSAIVHPALLITAPQDFWTSVFNVIQTSCGVQYQYSPLGRMLTGTLSQVARAGELLDLKWRQHCEDPQLRNVGYNNVSYQAGTIFSQHGTTMNQVGTTMNQVGTTMNQVGTNMNQVGTNMNQVCTNMNQVGTTMNQVGTTFNQRGTTFNPRDTNFNQSNMYRGSTYNQRFTNFTERGTTMSQVGAHFNQAGTNLNQHAPTFNPSGTNFNQMGLPFNHGTTFNQPATTNSTGRQDHMHSGRAFAPTAESQFNQQNVNYFSDPRYQQSGRNRGRQWANEAERRCDNNYTLDNQHPHADSDVRYDQPSDSKHLSIKEGTTNSNSFANTPNAHQEYTARSPCAGETDPRSGQPKTPQPVGNRSHQQPPGYAAKSPNPTFMKQDEASQSMTDPPSVRPFTSLDTTKTTQPLENGQNGTNTDNTTGAENTTRKVDGRFPLGKKESSLGGTTIPHPPVTNQQSLTLNTSTGPKKSTTSRSQFAPASYDTKGHRSEKPPISPGSNPSPRPPVSNQPSITPNISTGQKFSTTSGDQVESPSNDTADSGSERPLISIGSTKDHQPTVDRQGKGSTMLKTVSGAENVTTSSNPLGPQSHEKPEFPGEKPVGLGNKESSLGGTTIPHPTVTNQQSLTLNTSTGPKRSTTSSSQFVSASDDTTGHRSEKPPISPGSNPSPLPPVSNEQSITPNLSMGQKTSTTSSDQVGSPSNDTADSGSERPPISTESTTDHQPAVDHQGSTKLKTVSGAENVTTSSTPLGPQSNEKPEFPGEKPPGLSKTTTSAQPQGDDQQGTTLDPITRPQNSTNSNNDQPDAHTEKLPADSATTLQPTSNDQTGATQNPTIGSSENQTGTHSTSTSGCLSGKQSDTTEKTPNNKQQQQTIPDQISNQQTSTHENPNVEISPNNYPASKPGVIPRKLTEQSRNFKASPQKQVPVPKPRHNKPGTNERRQNAAKFSSPAVKPKQPGQGSPTSTEPNNNSLNDTTESTQNPKTSITTEQRDTMMDDELD